jgi:hypothetical protein
MVEGGADRIQRQQETDTEQTDPASPDRVGEQEIKEEGGRGDNPELRVIGKGGGKGNSNAKN